MAQARFAKGESGNLIRWLEATDPRGGRERVEYNNAAPNIASTEASAPAGFYNSGLQFRNTFYWDKKAMADAPGDYSKAQVFHWLATPEGKISGIKHSEKKALENRVWYAYPDQTDPAKVGKKRVAEPKRRDSWMVVRRSFGNTTTMRWESAQRDRPGRSGKELSYTMRITLMSWRFISAIRPGPVWIPKVNMRTRLPLTPIIRCTNR